MVYADLEGTLSEKIVELSWANSAGKLAEAEKILKHMLAEERRNLSNATNIDEFIEMNEISHRAHVKSGATLLKGQPPSILYAPLELTKASPKIFEMGERDRNLSIVTCTDEGPASYFCESHKVPFYNIQASSRLKVDPFTGSLTGEFERYCGGKEKADAYNGIEDVVGNSNGDLRLFKKAIESGHKAYLVRNGHGPMEVIFSETLDKFGLDYDVL